MYQNPEESKLQVLARDPLWINNGGKLSQIVNKYSKENIVRLKHCDGSHSDYRIGKNFTMIPEFGIILFKDANNAMKYSSLLDSPEGQEAVFKFWVEENRESNNVCMDVEDFDLPEGLYTIKRLDDKMTFESHQMLDEIRFLNNFDIFNSKCKKPVPIEDNDTAEVFIEVSKYLAVAEIEDEDKCRFCRLIFEVYGSGKNKKISVFPIYAKNIGTPYGFLRFSYLNGFPVFCSQMYAVNFRNYVRQGKSAVDMTFGERLRASTNAYERRCKAEDHKNKAKSVAAFALNHWKDIASAGKWCVDKLSGGGKKS